MLQIIILTLVVYSLIAMVVYVITGQNEDVLAMFGLGIVGIFLLGVHKLIVKIRDVFKYKVGKRSIFEEEATGKKYKCKTNDTHNVSWVEGYKLIKRYAIKSEWCNIPDFDNEFIEHSKINCDNCKHDKECQCGYPYTKIKCKHDEYGAVLEFDKFEK